MKILLSQNNEMNVNILNQMYDILINNLFITYPSFVNEKDKHDNIENKNKWFNMINNTKDYEVIVYEENNEVQGFLNYCIIDNEMWISEVQVKYKNKKIMKQLIEKFVSIEKVNDYNTITIHINDDNELSKKVFKHIGFKYIGNTLYKIDLIDLIKWVNNE